MTPYISPYGYPNGVSGGQKSVEETKKLEDTNVLIPSTNACYLTIASSGFFLGGCLRVPTRRCDLVVPVDGGWGRSNKQHERVSRTSCEKIGPNRPAY